MAGDRNDTFAREFSFHGLDLAACTASAATTDRIEIHAELPGRLQHRRAERKPPPFAGRAENDQCVARSAHDAPFSADRAGGARCAAFAARPRLRRGR